MTLTMNKEKEIITETTIIDIETKSDSFDPIQQHNGENLIVTKSDQPHNGKKINQIIVSQYMEDNSYAVTYSKEDNSILGWNIEENGQQQHVYFKLDKSYYIHSFI